MDADGEGLRRGLEIRTVYLAELRTQLAEFEDITAGTWTAHFYGGNPFR
jgi:hypothetical protein